MINNTSIIGIDPGKSGAIAIIYPNGDSFAWNFDSEFDTLELLRDIKKSENKLSCYMEEVGGFIGKKQPGSRMFSFGNNYGFLRGILMAEGISTELVRPQKWQKGLSGLSGLKDTQRKRALKEHACRLFPKLKPTLKTCDALLIARYGYLINN